MNHQDIEPEFLAETDNYAVWRSSDDDDTIYHLELGGVTLHFTSEEWDEFVLLIRSAQAS
jgi:hypothetical protein